MYAQLKALQLDASEQSPLKQCWTMQEVVPPGLSFSGQGEIETRFFQEKSRKVLGWKAPHQRDFSLESLMLAANTFAKDICDWELQFWGKHVKGLDGTPVLRFYTGLKTLLEQVDDRTCYLCLGEGAGWNKMSVGMLLERDTGFDFKKLRKTLRLAHDRLNFEYPKSRKLLMKSDDEIQDVFGWVKIQFS
jgi:CRISPR/Cas system CSM-associated protein Csm5 (group 7 of RAMP superfamily)